MFCSFHSTIKLTPIPISTDATYMQPGDFLEDDIEVEKVIGQNKLRVIWPRRDGDEPDPPGADIPKGWGHIIDTINTDIVIPAEHTINGRQFVGEYRIFHMHDGGKGAAVITSLMEIHPLNKRNSMINQFQLKFEEDMLKCQNKNRRKRGLRALVSSKGQNGVSSLRGKDNRLSGKEKFPSYHRRSAQYERDLERRKYLHDDPSDPYTSYGRWDAYDPELITSLWFYGKSALLLTKDFPMPFHAIVHCCTYNDPISSICSFPFRNICDETNKCRL